MASFDLIEFQSTARNTNSPKKLFELWEEVCKRYDRGQIGVYQLEEMKSAIWPRIHQLSDIKSVVDSAFHEEQQAA